MRFENSDLRLETDPPKGVTVGSGSLAANEEREKQGFERVTLIGWAEPPSYDAAAHKLYWAKELAFADNPDHTLNYNIRVLGRRGVLVLNAYASWL